MRDAVDGPGAGGAVVYRTRLYSSLVTRPTGRAVRLSIQERLSERRGAVVTVLDFRNVSVIDFSCADEVAAKLASAALDGTPEGAELFPLFVGLERHHLDPVESTLRRRGLVVAAERADGSALVLGELEEDARRAWHGVVRRGGGPAEALAEELELTPEGAGDLLETLHRRRLLLRGRDGYVPLRRAAASRGEDP